MKTIYLFILFIIVVVLQILVPTKMILDQEDVLATGKLYKFKTTPVDPNDPFRGKYITLNYDINKSKTIDSTWKRGDKILVYFDADSLGFAKLYSISRKELDSDVDYVEAKVTWGNRRANEVSFNLPFNRFYMEESKAKPAEEAYNRTARQRNVIDKSTYALVAVKNGKPVLKDVLINEIPIVDYIKNLDQQ